MIQQEEALAKILAHVRPLEARTVQLAAALDCFAAQDVFAARSLPLFDNSAMDGYAVVASSCAVGGRLSVVAEQPAGLDRQLTVRPGEAVRIFTGAPLPNGADTVVMQEDTVSDGSEIVLCDVITSGEHVRYKGADVAEGQKIVAAGQPIRPETMSLLAAQGMTSIAVGGQVRAAVISTGDELVAAGGILQRGQIYESNSILLHALLRKSGVEAITVEHCPDRIETIEAALRAGAAGDVIIISGGVSVGARDLVKAALAAVGAKVELWRVAVKPGKPFLFGHVGKCAVFGLPGNPVSAFVTFLLFVRPALLKLRGAEDCALSLPKLHARLAAEIYNDTDRVHYIRGALADGTFTPMGRQESHALFGLSRSNAMLMARPRERLPAGAAAAVLTWT